MKRNVVVLGVLIVLIVAGGVFYIGKSSNNQTGQNSQDSGGVFTSIKDALSKSISLECKFKDETGRETISFIKNGAVRANFNSTNTEEKGSVIVKDKKMYFWTEGEKEGFMMDLTDEEQEKKTESQPGSPFNKDEMMADLEKYKSSCKPSVVSDSLFTPPSNIKFVNFSQMMQGLGGQNNAPTIDPKQYEKLMQQYSQPPADSGSDSQE